MLERRDLGMRLAGLAMPAFTDDLTVFYDNAADAWIRMRRINSTLRKPQGSSHVLVIRRRESVHYFFLPSSSGNNDICSRLALASDNSCSRLISS